MTSLADRQQAIGLIDEARGSGARLKPACKELGITARTYQRWKREDGVIQDRRPHAVRPTPSNALTGGKRSADHIYTLGAAVLRIGCGDLGWELSHGRRIGCERAKPG